MSRTAVEKARELYEHHTSITIPVDMESLAREEGCELIEWPFPGPVKEVKQGRWIGIAQGLDLKERRYLVAHALAHHMLHCGNQLSFHYIQQGMRAKQEREADVFAAHILMPERELSRVVILSVWELADYFDVPTQLAYKRINEFATSEERERWNEASDNGSTY